MSEPDDNGARHKIPVSLDQFGEQIGFYRKSQSDIRLISDTQSFGWIRVDCKPLKQSLDLNLGKWVYLFTHYLNNRMLTRLKDFRQFLVEANAGLDVVVNKGDIDQLFAVLEAMLLIRSRVNEYNTLFDELNNTVELLKKHGVTVTDSLLQRIDEGPGLWLELKKRRHHSNKKKQRVSVNKKTSLSNNSAISAQSSYTKNSSHGTLDTKR